MSWTIPPETKYSYDLGSRGIVVWGIQRNLASLGHVLPEDGTYGRKTEGHVATFQEDEGLYVDGIFGPASSLRMAQVLEETVTVKLPERLIEGFVLGESAGHIGAVNWSVAGGVDCSYLQRRVLTGSDDATIQRAFDGAYQYRLVARTTRERYKTFYERRNTHSSQISYIQGAKERSWRLAALAHNWPYAADRLSNGFHLSDQEATWVPDGVTFENGLAVFTYWDWARFYALGAPEYQHRGLVTDLVEDWTP